MIETTNLTVTYRRAFRRAPFTAIDRLNLQIPEGEFFALLGENGAGKSTLMYCMLGLLRPTSGDVRVMGSTPKPGAAMFADIGYLPEEPHYHAYLTVGEAVSYYSALSGRPVAKERIDTLLERLGLQEHRNLLISRCSKGMKQKVGIAQCVLHTPRLLFLDEPMRGLDPSAVHLFRDLLLELNRGGSTIVMNSHLLSEVELVASRVAIIAKGRLLANDSVAALRAQHDTLENGYLAIVNREHQHV
jgi:ABC-type multidrug transport system ATPase subunit